MTDGIPDPLTVALQRLDADLAEAARITDDNKRAQTRAEAEQRWFTAHGEIFE